MKRIKRALECLKFKKSDLIAENNRLNKALQLEKMKSAYWIFKAKGEDLIIIASKDDIEYVQNDNINKSK